MHNPGFDPNSAATPNTNNRRLRNSPEVRCSDSTRQRADDSAPLSIRTPTGPQPPAGLFERMRHLFLQYPLLHFLLLDLRWTAVVLVIVVFGGLTILSMQKIWVRTPPGFRPVVRVSTLDLAQAWSLRRTAEHAEKTGDKQSALEALIGAVAQDSANVSLLRSCLHAAARNENLEGQSAARILAQIPWLLRLTQTNETDLHIATQLLRKYHRWVEIEELLRPRLEHLNPEEQIDYVAALFWLGKIDDFARAWEKLPYSLQDDPALRICHFAYMAAWGPPEKAAEGRRLLTAALDDPVHATLAHRANLIVSAALLDPAGYEKSLRRLEESRAARIADAKGYWRLLANTGRKEEARLLAENYLFPPTTPWEVLDQASAYLDLGMDDFACRFMRRYVPEFGCSPAGWSVSMWITYGELLTELRRWDELLDMTLMVRRIPEALLVLRGYISFLEGRALLAQGAAEPAARCFEYASHQDFPTPEIALKVGITLLQLGYPEHARAILIKLEDELANDVRLWQALLEVTVMLRNDSVEFYKAAQHAYKLAPNDATCINNYAAALLINRWQPDEAINLTRDLLAREPKLLQARINHAFSLAQTRRFHEARHVLATIDPSGLCEPDRTSYYLASAEINSGLSLHDEAIADIRMIDRKHLFPNQREWLEKLQKQLKQQPAQRGSAATE